MDETAEIRDEDIWFDGDAELRWEAVTRTLGFVIAVGALLASVGVWLLVSGQLLEGLCQTPKANTDKGLLDACQGRVGDGAPQLNALVVAVRPAAIALASSVGAVLVLGVMLLLGATERTRSLATSFDTPAIWSARVMAALAVLAIFWLAIVTIQRLLNVHSLL